MSRKRNAPAFIERLYNGPYLELFGRTPVDGWTVYGNQIAPQALEVGA